jgi:tRNA uridine 5-carboxymethylaminomethyl modification enzyme
LAEAVPELKEKITFMGPRKEEIVEATEVLLKYEGYIVREKLIAEKLERLENIPIKGRLDYASILSLSTEARQKLTRIDPETIGQASRIPGISPSDVNIILVLLGR